MTNTPVLILFAKRPLSGKVKTRLCPPLSFDCACELARVLIEQSMKTASKLWPGPVELHLWPDTNDKRLAGLSRNYGINLSTQSSGNLGKKMYSAFAQKHNRGHNALIMGCDVPDCPDAVYLQAYSSLENQQNVIGPTVDGGYYCIGVHRCDPAMFDGVDWGTDKAYHQTLLSCRGAGIHFNRHLPVQRDLDCYDDLMILSRSNPYLERFVLD